VLSDRRGFPKHLAASRAGSCLLAEPHRSLAKTMRKKVKIADVKKFHALMRGAKRHSARTK
jgi:hypothetical protein